MTSVGWRPTVSVVVPVYNGAGTLRELVSRLAAVLEHTASTFEVLLIDDGSRDDSSKVSGFRAFRVALRGAFDDFQGPFVNIDVMLTWATTKIDAVQVRHEVRHVGKTNYTFGRLLAHAANMLTGFSVVPLRISSFLGFLLTLFGVGALMFVLGRYLIGGVTVPGFPFL